VIKWIGCNISSIRGFSDGIISTNIVFKNGNIQGLAKIDPNFYFDDSKNLVLNQLSIEKNSTYSMTINLVCQK
jgi:hypothetical protein